MLKTRAATEASICVCVRMQEHELNINWLQALNIEKKKYSQVCLCLYNRIGTIHIRGNGHISRPSLLGTNVQICSMSSSHSYLIRSQSYSKLYLNSKTPTFISCMHHHLEHMGLHWHRIPKLKSLMYTEPNEYFMRLTWLRNCWAVSDTIQTQNMEPLHS